MGFFNKIFGSSSDNPSKKGGFESLKIKAIKRETSDTVKITFDVPVELKESYAFIPGQYLTTKLLINGREERRSYSICSGIDEDLSVAIKKIEGGIVSTWFNEEAKEGEEVMVSFPEGNFRLNDIGKNYVAVAAGSGITPIMAMCKAIAMGNQGSIKLFYGSRDRSSIIFHDEIETLRAKRVDTAYYLSKENVENVQYYKPQRLSDEVIRNIFKSDLNLLKADGYFLCGPEELIVNVRDVLKIFGVKEEKIYYELFTTPVLLANTESVASNFEGLSEVTVIIDDEETTFQLDSNGDTILSELDAAGIDAPYSCRGGVCSTCKAKILIGGARMDTNLALTDNEVKAGYILTCQAHPTSEKLTISFDE